MPVDPVLQDIDNRTANLMNKLANGQSVKDDLSGFLNKVSCLRYAPVIKIVYASSVTCFRLLFSAYKWEDPCPDTVMVLVLQSFVGNNAEFLFNQASVALDNLK